MDDNNKYIFNRTLELIDDLDVNSLIELKKIINERVENTKSGNWNKMALIREVLEAEDEGLKDILKRLNIKTIADLKKNNTFGIPERYIKRVEWIIKAFDFNELEEQYYNNSIKK